jgi:hypothetical protein
MAKFVKFCKEHIWAEFVSFGVGGMGIQELSKHLPSWLEFWIWLLGVFVMIAGAVMLGIGLLAQEREDKQDKTNSK